MSITLGRQLSNYNAIDTLIILYPQGKSPLTHLNPALPKTLVSTLRPLIKANFLKGAFLQSKVVHHSSNPKTVILVGTGKAVSSDNLRHALGTASRLLATYQSKKVAIAFPERSKRFTSASLGQLVSEGLLLGSYRFHDYKSEVKDLPKTLKVTHITPLGLSPKHFSDFKNGFIKGTSVAKGTNVARDVIHHPANIMTPQHVVDMAKRIFKKGPITLSLIDKKKAKTLGMNAFLGVAQGSIHDPYMLVLTYAPQPTKKPLCLVGKGVTFDTGGISIKPSRNMGDMKADMSGAAAVLGTMVSLQEIQPKQNVTAIIPLVENMPSATAQRPGDIVTAMNGKTIEILNTDAEGRLILADALCYANTLNPKQIIDIATLTGACIVALGDAAAAILSNSTAMRNRFKALIAHTGEQPGPCPSITGTWNY